ncbi:MAG: hypothetical protein WC578_05370 [Candidatus Omnitrophota bacterium]|jgi:hypothetical protein
MEFCKIRDGLSDINFETLRTDRSDYFEAVITTEELPKLIARFKSFFGEPASSSTSDLPADLQEKINDFGGIMPGQALYFKNEKNESIFAMLWPWQDGKRVTVKMACHISSI